MRITIDDEVLEPYHTMAQQQGRPLEAVVSAQLQRFNKLVPGKKAVVINQDALTALEPPLGGRPIKDAEDLLQRVNQLANISFEGINLELTLNQKQELAYRAQRQGRTVEFLVREIWQHLAQNFFWESGGGTAAAPPQSPAA